MGEITTVKLRKKTRDRLTELGSKGETYEETIQRLIEFYVKNNRERLGV